MARSNSEFQKEIERGQKVFLQICQAEMEKKSITLTHQDSRGLIAFFDSELEKADKGD